MSLTYVIPDIHGRLDLLCDGLAQIAARGPAGIIVTIGDYVDKGPASKGVIEQLTSGVGDRFSLIPLKGNHDALMVDALRDAAKMEAWIAKGGDAALASYGGDPAAVRSLWHPGPGEMLKHFPPTSGCWPTIPDEHRTLSAVDSL